MEPICICLGEVPWSRAWAKNRNPEELLEFLASCPTGPVSDVPRLEKLLAMAWEGFEDGGCKNMEGSKIYGRVEQPTWNPPVLTFEHERHATTVNGSSVGHVYTWTVDIDAGKADCNQQPRPRQLAPMAPRLDVNPIAENIVRSIIGQRDDNALKWLNSSKTKVTLAIGPVVPGRGPKQTTIGRRKRLRKVVTMLLADAGWKVVLHTTPNTFEKVMEPLLYR